MSKIFRLYKEGPGTYEGWADSPAFPYNSTARDTIDDPDGAAAKNEITSIPSPFARIDLVKTAFSEVNKRARKDIDSLCGNTIFHKMVSDSLDIGEIFFNIDKYKNQIEIITCNNNLLLSNLSADGNVYHSYVADSLNKYLQADGVTYNFNKLSNWYILNYINGPDELNIIGATSPATLFFSSANKFDYINDIYFANEDRPFDGEFQPLYKREFEYIKLWWTLRKSIDNFSIIFPEVEEYLQLTFKALKDTRIKQELNKVTEATSGDFSPIDVSEGQNNQVEVLGYQLYKKAVAVVPTVESDFEIKPDLNVDGILPLVLPVEAGNKYSRLAYVNGNWGSNNKAPYKEDEDDIFKRTLPFDGSVAPFLTISDFLEDSIVKVPHALNEEYFYGNVFDTNDDDVPTKKVSYLYPIKPLFFKYFKFDKLNSSLPNRLPVFELRKIAGGSVQALLRIPIKGNNSIQFVEYQRIYYKDKLSNVTATINEGGMTSMDFTGIVMPAIRFKNDEDALYTVSCINSFSNITKFDFLSNGSTLNDIPVDCRNNIQGQHDYKAETYTVAQNFDVIRVTGKNGISNILVPKFNAHNNNEDFEFAVDLGTSNTHIEFKSAKDKESKPFNFKESDSLACTIFIPSFREIGNNKKIQIDLKDEGDLIAADFIPMNVGNGGDFSFPTRTVLSYAKNTDWTTKLRTFGMLNFNLTYNKRSQLAYNAEPLVNIKWSNEANAQTAMEEYIRNIALLIRYYVVSHNGNLSNTKITWFYPNSMSSRRQVALQQAWDSAYQSMFSPNGKTIRLSESIAPIQYYFDRYSTATNLINVDIGGGTTDIAFSSGGKVNYISSFKLAANNLFEDSLANNPNNGIIDCFKNDIRRLLSNSGLSDLVNVFDSNNGRPADMASFLFALKDNSATKDLAVNKKDFNKILQNDTKFKIVFIIFYEAIIYHIAKIVKAKNIALPRHIAFSGNGSKVIRIISPDPKPLADFTKIIFETVTGSKFTTPLEILGMEQGSNPKEATCKGGLIKVTEQNIPENIVLKDSSTPFTEMKKYSDITEQEKDCIVDSVKAFFKVALKDVPAHFKLNEYFGVDNLSIKIALGEYENDLKTYLNKGITMSQDESGDSNSEIEDSLSFYPIKGAMNAISTRIGENK